jgi:hypothetical protein
MAELIASYIVVKVKTNKSIVSYHHIQQDDKEASWHLWHCKVFRETKWFPISRGGIKPSALEVS